MGRGGHLAIRGLIMASNRSWRGRTARPELSLGAVAFLRDDEYDPGLGGSLWPGNEHSWLLDHDDEPYALFGNAAQQVSGLSARNLVERYGAEYLKVYDAEHPGKKPGWWYRFNVARHAGV
jgi:hypothetical protein